MAGSNLIGGAEAASRKVRGVVLAEADADAVEDAWDSGLPVQAAKASAVVARVPVSTARRDTKLSGKSGTGMAHLPYSKQFSIPRTTGIGGSVTVFIKDSAPKCWPRELKLPGPAVVIESLAAVHEILAGFTG